MRAWAERFNSLFVVWVALGGVLAFVLPDAFTWFRSFIVPGLGVIMLGMGLTLTAGDLRRVRTRWQAVLFGAICQYAIMPLGGFAIARLLRLPEALAVGLILVAACPGGTASNVIAYLAGADVALSITMTTVSTLLSPVFTPLMLELYAGRLIDVSFADQALTIAKVIVVPVLAGLALRKILERRGGGGLLARLLHVFPSVSMLFIVLIVACIVALNADRLTTFGVPVVAAVILVNGLGLATGYALTRLFRFDPITARTVAIEVGMQNSGLGVALATLYFPGAAALPSAFYSLWHNLSGPLLASYWAGRRGGDQLGSPVARNDRSG